jgi:4'-phosphopantetheinyl transferase
MLDLWIAGIDQSIDDSLLDAEERAEVERYRFEADRKRAAMSRYMRRVILARYTDAELRFTKGRDGKPALVDDRQSRLSGQAESPLPHFNISHSADRVVLAVSNQPVGVDIEGPRDVRDARQLASRFFAPEEQAVIAAATDVQAAFFAIWTGKEAVIKAIGRGLSQALDSFVVHPVRDRYTAVESQLELLSGLNIRAFELDGGYRGAVAVRGNPEVSINWL